MPAIFWTIILAQQSWFEVYTSFSFIKCGILASAKHNTDVIQCHAWVIVGWTLIASACTEHTCSFKWSYTGRTTPDANWQAGTCSSLKYTHAYMHACMHAHTHMYTVQSSHSVLTTIESSGMISYIIYHISPDKHARCGDRKRTLVLVCFQWNLQYGPLNTLTLSSEEMI